jgi:hypothetical protein
MTEFIRGALIAVRAHVALAAAERGHAVLTSDDADIAKVNRDLILVHV